MRRRRHGWTVLLLMIGILSPFSRSSASSTISLAVDASESVRNILHVRETVSVRPGALTLFYPKWIPGEHGPTGPIADLVGLHLAASGREIRWRRDLVEMYAMHCDVPRGASTLDVRFDFLLPPTETGFSSAASSTPALLVLSWNQVVLYPLNERPDSITVTPTLTLHQGWKFATALEPENANGSTIHFKPVPLNVLIDSPVQTGRYFNRIDLGACMSVPYHLNIVSDDAAAVEMPAFLAERYKHLVLEAKALFDAHHFHHYDFLYTLSDQTAHFGLEHHQSSDDRVPERTLLDPDMRVAFAGLLPHEFVHSWNGKFRRPADLATGDYSTPMKDDLLWVYEGLTEYLGNILTARSGLWSPEEYRDHLAMIAAVLDNTPGREWRPLQDAADEASVLYGARHDWAAYRRGTDFYDEGDLIWLDVDVTIRQLTHGAKSLNDFCRLFHGGPSTGPALKPYTFEDVVAALNEVAPYDWRTFFTDRLQSLNPRAPLGGIETGGWRLVYRDTLNPTQRANEEARHLTDMRFSLGILLDPDGSLVDVIPGSPAAAAGIIPTMKLVSVNGRSYTPELLRAAVRSSTGTGAPIEMLTRQGNFFSTHGVNYHGGEKYPYLAREPAKPDLLDEIIAPIAGK